ncbi:nucleotidyltransferase [Thermococcus litoralis DSM 5473]|jgi:predicted nucleotidyltransferase|uniref:Nucleotidyltransferase n=2 Tax=Thermococcus litoralis TaxID=2265 RepID=H3ZLV8_THELN|nr:nucleotidyltransferase [Thermococcus litoralis DSM 5473]
MQSSNLPTELNRLMETAKKFKKTHKKVFDIVLYGSSVKGKGEPNDYDFMLILRKAREDDRFDLAFEFKQRLLDLGFPHDKLDVKALNLEDLFDPNYLASPGIIIEGFSLTKGKPIHELLNGESYALFVLDVSRLEGNEKTKFQFALKGRDGKGGIIKELSGRYLGPWVVLVPIEEAYRFKEFLDFWGVKFESYLMFGVKGL